MFLAHPSLPQASGSLDILVNNAGMAQTGALLDMPLDVIRAHMDTNVMGAVRMIQLVSTHSTTG